MTTTGDAKHPRLDRFTYKPARHRGKAIDRTVAKINSQKLPSAISALTRDVRERLKTLWLSLAVPFGLLQREFMLSTQPKADILNWELTHCSSKLQEIV